MTTVRNRFSRPPFWASFLTLIGFCILCALGAWQVQRLHWKETLLVRIDAAYLADPLDNKQTGKTLNDAASNNVQFIRGSITGHFTKDAPLRSGPRPMEEKAGYHLYAPFRTADGAFLLVNRGWVPQAETPPASPAGQKTLTGLFRTADRANFFTPANDTAQNIWFRFDPASLTAHYKQDALSPYILYLEPSGDISNGLPQPVGQRPAPNNNHRQYAFFWFAMAGVLLVIYLLRFIATARR